MKSKLTAEYFRKMYRYEPLTGKFYSNYVGNGFKFNQELALSVDASNRYRLLVSGERYLAHRLAVLYMLGEFPALCTEVDHINRDPSDNRWENLRVVTSSQNKMNTGTRCDNSSGVKGVSYVAPSKLWVAKIGINKKYIHLGSFPTKEAAITARKIAEAKYHGEYAVQE